MKPIKLTENLVAQMLDECRKELLQAKLSDGKFSFVRSLSYKTPKDKQRVSVIFTPIAYLKMYALISHYSGEVGWHGTVRRVSEHEYRVDDIFVYPQTVSGATVNTDQEVYQKWLMSLDDDVFNALRMQGHSHVDFSVSPSGVDTALYEKILSQFSGEDFYIFGIFNKKSQRNIMIYDYAANIQYENEDIDLVVADEGFDLLEFLDQADKLVETRAYSTGTAGVSNVSVISGGNAGRGGNAQAARFQEAGGKESVILGPKDFGQNEDEIGEDLTPEEVEELMAGSYGRYGRYRNSAIRDYDDYIFNRRNGGGMYGSY